MTKRRNPLAQAPIMRKGGVHEKSRSAQRSAAKRDLQREVRRQSNKQGTDRSPYSFDGFCFLAAIQL